MISIYVGESVLHPVPCRCNLCRVQAQCSPLEEDSFLRDIDLTALTADDKTALEYDLTTEEVGQAIRALQSGKAIGPNGLPVELSKEKDT
ncbi:hypothetical protein NDU88_001213 [Pleurodeles waltl]|uniref:Uncharacterized protein n=1 Tax=Pleurodeles waltl TaxID=8319 RepID=A0AAV7SAC0_PLEWA|nr:hypothetical protein NDU88_001213 [Pleurodeles waltl]